MHSISPKKAQNSGRSHSNTPVKVNELETTTINSFPCADSFFKQSEPQNRIQSKVTQENCSPLTQQENQNFSQNINVLLKKLKKLSIELGSLNHKNIFSYYCRSSKLKKIKTTVLELNGLTLQFIKSYSKYQETSDKFERFQQIVKTIADVNLQLFQNTAFIVGKSDFQMINLYQPLHAHQLIRTFNADLKVRIQENYCREILYRFQKNEVKNNDIPILVKELNTILKSIVFLEGVIPGRIINTMVKMLLDINDNFLPKYKISLNFMPIFKVPQLFTSTQLSLCRFFPRLFHSGNQYVPVKTENKFAHAEKENLCEKIINQLNPQNLYFTMEAIDQFNQKIIEKKIDPKFALDAMQLLQSSSSFSLLPDAEKLKSDLIYCKILQLKVQNDNLTQTQKLEVIQRLNGIILGISALPHYYSSSRELLEIIFNINKNNLFIDGFSLEVSPLLNWVVVTTHKLEARIEQLVQMDMVNFYYHQEDIYRQKNKLCDAGDIGKWSTLYVEHVKHLAETRAFNAAVPHARTFFQKFITAVILTSLYADIYHTHSELSSEERTQLIQSLLGNYTFVLPHSTQHDNALMLQFSFFASLPKVLYQFLQEIRYTATPFSHLTPPQLQKMIQFFNGQVVKKKVIVMNTLPQMMLHKKRDIVNHRLIDIQEVCSLYMVEKQRAAENSQEFKIAVSEQNDEQTPILKQGENGKYFLYFLGLDGIAKVLELEKLPIYNQDKFNQEVHTQYIAAKSRSELFLISPQFWPLHYAIWMDNSGK